jgi:hypothetical protein
VLPRRRAGLAIAASASARRSNRGGGPGQIDLYAELTFHPLNTFSWCAQDAARCHRAAEPRTRNGTPRYGAR